MPNDDNLRALLGDSTSYDKFMKVLAAGGSHVLHAPLSHLESLCKAPELMDVYSLLEAVEKNKDSRVFIKAWFTTPKGVHEEVSLSPESARKLYGLGNVTLGFSQIHLISEAIYNLTLGIESDLGSSRMNPSCNAYASPPGVGTAMHFDAQENFNLQIRGRKRWTVAPNNVIQYPQLNYFPGSGKNPFHFLQRPFPTAMPGDSESHVLEPGSVYFFPRGYWHETHTLEESFALTLTYPTPSWLNILGQQLDSSLAAREDVRKPIYGVDEESATAADFDSILQGVQATLRSKEFRDACLQRARAESVYFWRNPNVRMSIETAKDGSELRIRNGNEEVCVAIGNRHRSVVEWIVNQDASCLTAEKVKSALGDSEAGKKHAHEILEVLASQGVFKKRHGVTFEEVRAAAQA